MTPIPADVADRFRSASPLPVRLIIVCNDDMVMEVARALAASGIGIVDLLAEFAVLTVDVIADEIATLESVNGIKWIELDTSNEAV